MGGCVHSRVFTKRMRIMMSSFFLAFCLQVVSLASLPQQEVATNAELGALFQASLDQVGQGKRMEFEDLWVRALLRRYPELHWYAQAGIAASQEGEARKRPDSFSVRAFGEYYPEFDRTLMVLKCYFLIQSGTQRAYEVFVAPQKESPLTREHFDRLHARLYGLISDEGNSGAFVRDAFLAALVLGDVGKIDAVHVWMERYGIKDLDHDVFYGSIMERPEAREAFPSFANLSPDAQALLVKTANLGHWGHITHLEGGFSMFEPLKASGILETDYDAFVFESLVHSCDVAGAGGHRNTSGSVVYSDNTFLTLESVYFTCSLLADKDERFAYYYYLGMRAGGVGLAVNGGLSEVLGRLAAMLRLYDATEGEIIEEAARAWSPEQRALVLKMLSVSGASRLPETPTYMPAALVNMLNNPGLGATKEVRLREVVVLGVPWLSAVLEDSERMLASGAVDASIPLNLNEAAGQLKGDPLLVKRNMWRIDPNTGSVSFTKKL